MQFIKQSFKNSLSHFFPIITYGVFIFIATVSVIVASYQKLPLTGLTRDPAAIFETTPFVGLISNFGNLLWAVTASVCLFSGLILRNLDHKRDATFMISSGLVCSMLLIDDFLMIHEYIFPIYFSIGEEFVFLAYFIIIISYLFFFRKKVLKTNFVLLITAFVFFGCSILMDYFIGYSILATFIEDTLKTFGICTWFIYFSNEAFSSLQKKQGK